jgi:hypothetical protein
MRFLESRGDTKMIAINFSIKAGGSLLFLGLFEEPEALRQIQLLHDNGAYAVISSHVGYDCEECKDTGHIQEREGRIFCGCNLGLIMEEQYKRSQEATREVWRNFGRPF